MALPIYTVDAFTDRPFAGNPAGVCLLQHASWPDEAWMAAVAAEMNHAETAFVLPEPTTEGTLPIRYFTPAIEVELCGHATLATAHVFFTHADVGRTTPVAFRTIADQTLTCVPIDQGGIAMDFPIDTPAAVEAPPGLLDALGLTADDVVAVARGRYDVLVQLASPEAVRSVRPDFRTLTQLDTRGVCVTAAGGRLPNGRAADFTSRFFAPAAGIDEDPVTGSAHCLLGPYWADRLGRDALLAYQASKRGGWLHVHTQRGRVSLIGQAVTTLIGKLTIDPPRTPG